MKKTVKIAELRAYVNEHLAGAFLSVEQKKAFCNLIEDQLLKCQAYSGFQFLNTNSKPGDDDYYSRRYL